MKISKGKKLRVPCPLSWGEQYQGREVTLKASWLGRVAEIAGRVWKWGVWVPWEIKVCQALPNLNNGKKG